MTLRSVENDIHCMRVHLQAVRFYVQQHTETINKLSNHIALHLELGHTAYFMILGVIIVIT